MRRPRDRHGPVRHSGVAAALVPRRVPHGGAPPADIAGKGLGKLVDAFRIAAWVRRHDVVIVPGTGILESTLPLRPWGMPYSLFLVCAAGRLLRTPVALVGVGASGTRS